MTRRAIHVLCLVLAILPAVGCSWRRSRPNPPVATPPPKPALPTVEPAPAPPKLATTPSENPPPSVSTNLPETPNPPQPKRPVRRTRARATTQPVNRAPETKTPERPSADPGSATSGEAVPMPAPRLGELLTDAQRQDLTRQYEQAVAGARSALERLSARRLTPAETEAVDRIRAFLLQAESAKARDLHTALQLAQRAGVLAQDLLNR